MTNSYFKNFMNTVCPVNNNRKVREGFSGLSDLFGSSSDSSGNDPNASTSSGTTADPSGIIWDVWVGKRKW